ncbi:MAG: acyl carrier protein [Clostridiales bacterium]|nr:acyl carrier protein [Clostridiales bacterium]MDU3239276.1 acyl carrier protein [Clostridiales bacterium]
MKNNLKEELRDIVCEIIETEPEALLPEALFYEDLGMDSLRALEILAVIENRYSITIDPEMLTQMTSLNKVVEITEQCLERKK